MSSVQYVFKSSFAVALCLSLCRFASAQNLVQNPGFETGDFTDWNTPYIPVTSVRASGFVFKAQTYLAHSGTYFASLGANTGTGPATFTQDIATSPGQTYTVSFWLLSDGLTPNLLDATFGGATVLNASDIPLEGYTLYSADVAATSNSTLLSFTSLDSPGYLALDDVSVTANSSFGVPEPSTYALLGSLSLTAAGFLRRRRK